MPTLHENASEPLSGEILADAQHECQAILQRARQEAERILADAEVQAAKWRQGKREAAEAESRRHRETQLATVAIEIELLRLRRVERLLDALRDNAIQHLRAGSGFDPGTSLTALAAEALGQMSGREFWLKISAQDHASVGQAMMEAVRRRTNRAGLSLRLVTDSSVTDGGVIIEDTAGTELWDNRLTARLARLWPGLRRQIALQTSLATGGTAGGEAA
jgi:vacuolar-type H+-ATPase subunit E/Vma4